MTKITIEPTKTYKVNIDANGYQGEYFFEEGEHLKNHIERRKIKLIHMINDEDLRSIDAAILHVHPTVNGEKVKW